MKKLNLWLLSLFILCSCGTTIEEDTGAHIRDLTPELSVYAIYGKYGLNYNGERILNALENNIDNMYVFGKNKVLARVNEKYKKDGWTRHKISYVLITYADSNGNVLNPPKIENTNYKGIWGDSIARPYTRENIKSRFDFYIMTTAGGSNKVNSYEKKKLFYSQKQHRTKSSREVSFGVKDASIVDHNGNTLRKYDYLSSVTISKDNKFATVKFDRNTRGIKTEYIGRDGKPYKK